MKRKTKALEAVLWSIALPGFGQFINQKYIKGILLIVIEIIINVKASLNVAIVHSFYGQMEAAIQHSDYQWLMFYPCFYMFGIWDAYRDAGGYQKSLSFLPFVFAAYIGTVGVVYSKSFTIFGRLLGPIFLPMISLFIGVSVGIVVRKWLLHTFVRNGPI